MKIEFYGRKEVIDKVREDIERYLKKLEYPVYKVYVFLKDVPKECIDCMYFPCKEECKIKVRK